MPRIHKENCQCAVCKKIRAKEAREIQIVEREIIPIVIPEPATGPTLDSIQLGECFIIANKIYRKLYQSGGTCSVDEPGSIGGSSVSMPSDTPIVLISKVRLAAEPIRQ